MKDKYLLLNILKMDITLFFWNFIDYELQPREIINAQEERVFDRIRQGDIIMNVHHLDDTESDDFLYYESLKELISMAGYVCTGEKLKKIQKYVERYFEDEELAEMLEVEV